MRTTDCINRAIQLQNNGKPLSDRVKTEVVKFVLSRKSHGRRGQPSLPSGTELYAIQYELGGYFTYSYTTIKAAEESRQNQIYNQTNTFQFYGFNVVDNVNDTMPCSK
jgi:hypothetical protein